MGVSRVILLLYFTGEVWFSVSLSPSLALLEELHEDSYNLCYGSCSPYYHIILKQDQENGWESQYSECEHLSCLA